MSAPVTQFLLGNVCSSFPYGCVDITKNGWFWLSAGLEYLPSGISGLASAAAALPAADWDPVGTSASHSMIRWCCERAAFLQQQPKPNPQQFMEVLQFREEFSSMACWTANHKWQYAYTGSSLVPLTGTVLPVWWCTGEGDVESTMQSAPSFPLCSSSSSLNQPNGNWT